MNQSLWFALANNAALLLTLFIAYEVSYIIGKKHNWLRQIVSGVLVAIVCIIVMGVPFQLYPGIVFDTRSILISVASMFFGPVTALITAAAAILFRLSAGGEGTIAGIAVIMVSMIIGLAWRRWLYPRSQRRRVLNVYIMGIAVHSSMLACMFLIPYPNSLHVISSIALPVMFIYPIASVLLSTLLLHEQERRRSQEQLRQSEERFQLLFNKAPLGYQSLDSDGRFIEVNQQWTDTFGYKKEEVIGRSFGDFLEQSYVSAFEKRFEIFKRQGHIHSEYEMMTNSGASKFIAFEGKVSYDADGAFRQTHCILQDITEQRKMEQALRESERSKSVLLSHIPGLAYRCAYDREWTMQYISDGCYALTGYKADELINNKTRCYKDIICEEYREELWNEWARVIADKKTFNYEYEIMTAAGERKWVLEMGQHICDLNGQVEALEGIIIDITESKKYIDKIQHMATHDSLTDLYNRHYLEKVKEQLDNDMQVPVAVIMADINGVRLINDAFGHAEGDRIIIKTAELIKSCCRSKDILARTGGDEFTVILPNTDYEKAYEIITTIKEACSNYNALVNNKAHHINLSLGFGVKQSIEQSLDKTFIEAEEYLYGRKLLERESHHNAILTSLMATMYARSHETEEHARRLAALSRMIGEKLDLPQKSLDDLQVLSMLHDVGKVGVDDRILNKPGILTKEEWTAMKKHTEIGYRIAVSSPDFKGIAEYILSHHERWDGNGYPQGLKGENIPLLSRILAVADAYDAMTEDRVYRKALTKEAAIEEIRLNSGTQFDPQIVKILIENIEEYLKKN